jgi:hypothetical protein
MSSRDWSWPLWALVPLYPYGQRRTICTEVLPNTIWTFEQSQGILYVVVPIRMTVVKLQAGGLLVYAPVAPTLECVRLIQELIAIHGEVRYIILPTVSGLEHKVFVGPFAKRFPQAQVFVAPQQWSFPLNLPLHWLGFPRQRTQILPEDSTQTPFADEFDYALLGPIQLGLGAFGEAVFLHKRSRTLLVTDIVVAVPENPPEIVQLDPYPLLFHAKDHGYEVVEDTVENRRKGWQRIALFAFYFRPSALDVLKTLPSLRDALNAPDRSQKSYFGWFPFRWRDDWWRSFQALRGNGRLFVAPILQTLILNRAPKETIVWADQVSRWDFCRIIPCHFQAPIAANGREFRQAFAFLEALPFGSQGQSLPEEDFELLKALDQTLTQRRITPPAQGKVP